MNPRIVLYSFIAGFILILMFFFIGKAFGKSLPPDPVALPEDAGGESGAQLSSTAIEKLTDEIHEDIYDWWTRNSEPYVKLLALSNTDFVRVYNDWNARYFKKDNETLKVAIEGEKFSVTSFTFANIKDDLMNRFTALGLK